MIGPTTVNQQCETIMEEHVTIKEDPTSLAMTYLFDERRRSVNALKLEVLSVIAKQIRRRMLDKSYGETVIDENKTDGYYAVKWEGPLQEL